MAIQKPFPHTDFLAQLQRLDESTDAAPEDVQLLLAGMLRVTGKVEPQSQPVSQLMQLLKSRRAVLQAALEIEQVADELRRCQRFARPGQPSAALVRLRQQQASARQASSVARQHFIVAATAFARVVSIEVPPRLSLESFMIHWIERNVPVDSGPAS